jgi:septum formation protein
MTAEKQPRLILASSSPRRKDLLEKLGIPFEVITSGVSEDVDGDIDPKEMVVMLAKRKAGAVAQSLTSGIVIGSDTTIAFEGQVLGKPKDEEEAKAILKSLKGKHHQVYSGMALVNAKDKRVEATSVMTSIKMRNYSDEEIDAYVATGEPMDKAGAYAIQGQGGRLVDEIKGSFDNVVGLPIRELAELLRRFGFDPDTSKTETSERS